MASEEWSQETVPLAGIAMAVIKGGKGKPLLVLHDELGYPGWLEWQRELAAERALIIPMAPGFGRTPRIEWIESVRDLACVYARFLREQRLDQADVIGFSFGGWLAAEMMANNPRQFDRAVLVAPGEFGSGRGVEHRCVDIVPRRGLKEVSDHALGSLDSAALYGGASTPVQYEAWEDARAEFARLAWQPYFHNPSLPHLLEGVGACSTLLLWGRQDRVIPQSVMESYKRVLHGSRLVMFDDCGHRPEIEKTKQFVSEVKEYLAA